MALALVVGSSTALALVLGGSFRSPQQHCFNFLQQAARAATAAQHTAMATMPPFFKPRELTLPPKAREFLRLDAASAVGVLRDIHTVSVHPMCVLDAVQCRCARPGASCA
jgi:hypothetical protein